MKKVSVNLSNIMPTQTPNRRAMFTTTLLLGASLWLGGCKKAQEETDLTPEVITADAFNADVATKWADLELKLIRTTAGFTPPVASRALGYSGVALYEAVVPGSTKNQSLVNQLSGLTSLPRITTGASYNWAISANASQANIVRKLFPTTSAANKVTIDSLETALNAALKTASLSMETYDRSVQFGKDVSDAIFEWSKTDGGHEGYSRNQPKDYVPPVGPGLWVQTVAGDAGRAVQPTWGQNRTLIPANSILDPGPPIAYSTSVTSPFFTQGLEVYTTIKNLTDEQKAIALFWADGGGTITPPGHSYSLASIAIKKDKANLDKAVEAYAKVGIAVNDAFICCWKCKYTYNLMRPETFIKTAIDPNFKPFLTTPNFPEFSSGHSTQSGASALALSDVFGYNYAFTDNTHDARGLKARSYPSFLDAAAEAAVSRLYGGIHFRYGNETGIAEGRKIGSNVLALKFKK